MDSDSGGGGGEKNNPHQIIGLLGPRVSKRPERMGCKRTSSQLSGRGTSSLAIASFG